MDNTCAPSRRFARVIGFIDLVFASMQLVSIVGLLYEHYELINYYYSPTDDDEDGEPTIPSETAHSGALTAIIVVLVVLSMIYLIFRFLAVGKLIKSTTSGTPVHEAWRHASFWRVVTVVFFVLRLGLLFRSLKLVFEVYVIAPILILSIIDGIFIYLVSRYMNELDKHIPKTFNTMIPLPTTVSRQVDFPRKGDNMANPMDVCRKV